MRAILRKQELSEPSIRLTLGGESRCTVGLGLLLVMLLIGSTANAGPRQAHLQSSSSNVLWFGRSAEVADAIAAWRHARTDDAVQIALGALERRLHRRDYQDATSLVCMGMTAQGEAERAIAFCEKALRNRGDRDWRHVNNLANAQLQAGRNDEAIANYERSIQLIAKSGSAGRAPRLSERERLIQAVLQPNLDLAQQALAGAAAIANQTAPARPDEAPLTLGQPITRLAGSAER